MSSPAAVRELRRAQERITGHELIVELDQECVRFGPQPIVSATNTELVISAAFCVQIGVLALRRDGLAHARRGVAKVRAGERVRFRGAENQTKAGHGAACLARASAA